MRNSIFLLLLFLSFINCKKKTVETPTYNKGELTVVTDESFKSVAEALAEGYMINYPETEIKVKTQKEDLAFLDLLKDKARIIIMSRELDEKEIAEYKKQVDLDYQPAKFAVDAVVFVAPKNASVEKLTLKDIEAGLQSDEKPFIFDGTNSSNLNFVAQKLGKKPSELKFNVISGNENVVQQLNKYPNKIGVISLNTISRPYGEEAAKLRDMVKILPIEDKGKMYNASIENLINLSYPYARTLYFLTNEGGFNIANGFMRFSCTQLGQMIVQKEGLQRYNMYTREVQMR